MFGGLTALINSEIDLLISPDPVCHPKIEFFPVFNYELVGVMSSKSTLLNNAYLNPKHFLETNLYTYPVPTERLDIYTKFLIPENISPNKHIRMESTDLILQIIQCNKGITALLIG